MGKKINELDAVTDAEAIDATRLFASANPVDGIAKKMTLTQAKLAFIAVRFKYVADGTEGSSLMISAIAGKNLLLVTRENGVLYNVLSAPDSTEYTWDGSVIGLGASVGAGERFNIIYNNG